MQGFLNPEQVLKQLKLQEEMNAADFGSGSGGWAIPLAKKLEGGKVYAVDLLEEPLSALRAKINLGRITNIQIIRADVEKGVNIFEESLDLVLMTNLLFEVEDIKKVLQEGKRLLKRGGKILVVDWKKDAPLGPKKRVSAEEIKKLAEEIGLKLEKPSTRAKLGAGPVPHRNEVSGAGEFSAGTYHFGLVLVK